MTRARMPRPHEVAAARRDARLIRAFAERDEDMSWRARGACRTVDPEVFFPAPSEPADRAVALCQTCDVQGACLAWALDVGDCHGVWGATTPRERRAMLIAWRDAAPALQPAPVLQPALAGSALAPGPTAHPEVASTTLADTEFVQSRAASSSALAEPALPDQRRRPFTEPASRRRAAALADSAVRRGAVLGLATPA